MLHAAVIGIDHFADRRINALSFAGADALSVRTLLEERIAPSELRLCTLLDDDATRENILSTIGDHIPGESQSDDIVMFYFAGHGSPETNSDLDNVSRYLITHDTVYDKIFATGIDVERDLPRCFARTRAKLVVMFIDACFSGRAGGRSFEGPNAKARRSLFRGPDVISLKKLELGRGRIFMSACGEDQVAQEDKRLAHGVFTHFLIDALTRSDRHSSTIGLASLYEQVSGAVRDFTNGRQIPVMNGISEYAHFPRLASR